MRTARPDVFTYHDCRAFLVDICAHLKATLPGFSVARLASDAKVSKGYLSMVLSGERKITAQALNKIMPHLALSHAEETYLSLLGANANAESQNEKSRILEQIHKLRSYQKNNPNEALTYRYLSRWYHIAIREMSALENFKLDAKWLQARLKPAVALADIEKAILFLTESQLLKVDEFGHVRPPDMRIECIDEVYKVAMLKFHEQMFSLAIEQIPNLQMPQKNLTAHTVAMSPASFAQIKELLGETLNKIVEIAQQDKTKEKELYHFGLLGFSLTQKNPEVENE